MSSRSDLYSMLRGEGAPLSFLHKLAAALEAPNRDELFGPGPFTCKAWYWMPGSSKPDIVADFNVRDVASINPENVVERLEHEICEEHGLGMAPVGMLRVRFYADGKQSKPIVTIDRTLSAGPGHRDVVDIDWITRRLYALERDDIENRRTMKDVLVAVTGLAANQATTIKDLATYRAPPTAAADAGVWGLLVMAGMSVAYPAVKKSLGLSQNASWEDFSERLGEALKATFRRSKEIDVTHPPMIPPGVADEDIPVPPPEAIDEQPSVTLDQVKAYAANHEDEIRELIRERMRKAGAPDAMLQFV